jgi:putative transposase
MARPLRIEYEGAHYHVTTRGNERKAIFRDDIDRRKFIELVAGAVEQFDLRIHAYVLMDNHYHLMVESGQTGLSRALRYLNGVYTQSINRRHKRAGHLFQGRYKAILVEKESYLLELSRYIHLNPWRVKSSIDPMKYPWSSLGYYLATRAVPPWFTVTEVLSRFGKKGKQGYREFIEEGIRQGIRTPWEDIRGQAVMGSEEFIKEAVSRHCAGRGKKAKIARRRELVAFRPEAILATVGKYYGITAEEIVRRGWRYTEARYVAIYLMRRYGFMGLREIGERVGLHFSSVGNALQRMADNPNRTLAQTLRALEDPFKNQES